MRFLAQLTLAYTVFGHWGNHDFFFSLQRLELSSLWGWLFKQCTEKMKVTKERNVVTSPKNKPNCRRAITTNREWWLGTSVIYHHYYSQWAGNHYDIMAHRISSSLPVQLQIISVRYKHVSILVGQQSFLIMCSRNIQIFTSLMSPV